MHKGMFCLRYVWICCLACLVMTLHGFPLWAVEDAIDTQAVYTVATDDGAGLKMLRYRPSPDAPFREGGQPVLLIPGILTSMNQFLTHTPTGKEDNYKNLTLPSVLPQWARNEPYIAQDPMRFYSIAHYFWVKGYDCWLFNYRGTGHGTMVSTNPIDTRNITNLDVWALVDTDACVNKVIELTGQAPFIGGHSTGGFSSYAYLQGAYFDIDELKAGYAAGYIPHVKHDPFRAAYRNTHIKGFIGLDPGVNPPMPQWMDFNLMWAVLSQPVYLPIDELISNLVNPYLPDWILSGAVQTIFGSVNSIARNYGWSDYFSWIIPYINFWDMSNTSPYVADYYARYCATSAYMRGGSQWVDRGLNLRTREHWMNGEENMHRMAGPKPAEGDGYYYYDTPQHMSQISVPAIAVLNATGALVLASEVVSVIFEQKTPNANDEYYVIPNTGHAEIPCGLNAPYEVFPKIGAWMEKVCQAAAAASEKAGNEATGEDDTEAQAVAGGSDSSSSSGMCFIGSVRF